MAVGQHGAQGRAARASDVEDRRLQGRIADAGYAGLPYPVEYGGRGLTLRHQEVFYEEGRVTDCRPASACRWA